MKKYKHKKTGWIAKGYDPFYVITDSHDNYRGSISVDMLEDSNDWVTIEEEDKKYYLGSRWRLNGKEYILSWGDLRHVSLIDLNDGSTFAAGAADGDIINTDSNGSCWIEEKYVKQLISGVNIICIKNEPK